MWSDNGSGGNSIISNGSGSSGGGNGKANIKLQEIKASRVFRQSENESSKVVKTYAPTIYTPRRYHWYSFLLGAESPTGP